MWRCISRWNVPEKHQNLQKSRRYQIGGNKDVHQISQTNRFQWLVVFLPASYNPNETPEQFKTEANTLEFPRGIHLTYIFWAQLRGSMVAIGLISELWMLPPVGQRRCHAGRELMQRGPASVSRIAPGGGKHGCKSTSCRCLMFDSR
jgi:hypothetical protein